VEGNLPGPLERAVVLCRGAATNCYVHICMSHIKDEGECQERRMNCSRTTVLRRRIKYSYQA
jgi:hypothetical protein